MPMSAQKTILPDGRSVNMDLIVDYTLSSYTITFTRNTGTTFTYADPFGNIPNAQYVKVQLDAGVQIIQPSPIVIILPPSFDVSLTITIRGSGFTAATVGKLRFEDTGGGFDDNGYYMTCTFVNETTLTAVFTSVGDGTLNAGDNITYAYYKDSAGRPSNVITATNPSGTLITIP